VTARQRTKTNGKMDYVLGRALDSKNRLNRSKKPKRGGRKDILSGQLEGFGRTVCYEIWADKKAVKN